MRYLISTTGSHGDILPFVLVAKELELNGHEVIFYANEYFAYLFENSKIKFVSIGTKESYFKLFKTDANNNPTKALKAIAKELAILNKQFYYKMLKDISSEKDTLISSSLLFAAHLLKETHNINYVLIHLSPSIFRSNIEPARLSELWISKDSPLFIKNFAWWALDTFFYEPNFTKPLNAFRRELNLPTKSIIFKDWIHEADKTVALFPEWFANIQKDVNCDIVQTNFLLTQSKTELTQNIQYFINSDKPTVVFTAGTANGAAHKFFKASLQALQKLDIQAIFVSHFNEHIPQNLPSNILHINYVPYDALLPQVSLFVHHGGIGSTAVALQSGVPQIICPTAYDQFDNSIRVVKLGVATEILPKNYNAKNIANTINNMLNSKNLKIACEFYAQKFIDKNTIKDIYNTIAS